MLNHTFVCRLVVFLLLFLMKHTHKNIYWNTQIFIICKIEQNNEAFWSARSTISSCDSLVSAASMEPSLWSARSTSSDTLISAAMWETSFSRPGPPYQAQIYPDDRLGCQFHQPGVGDEKKPLIGCIDRFAGLENSWSWAENQRFGDRLSTTDPRRSGGNNQGHQQYRMWEAVQQNRVRYQDHRPRKSDDHRHGLSHRIVDEGWLGTCRAWNCFTVANPRPTMWSNISSDLSACFAWIWILKYVNKL